MRTNVYDRLITLYKEMHDSSKPSAERIKAASDFERIAETCDENMRAIIRDAIGEAPSLTASLLYTWRAANNDYAATNSFFSAAGTFFKVANTRLHSPTHEQREETDAILEATRSEEGRMQEWDARGDVGSSIRTEDTESYNYPH